MFSKCSATMDFVRWEYCKYPLLSIKRLLHEPEFHPIIETNNIKNTCNNKGYNVYWTKKQMKDWLLHVF